MDSSRIHAHGLRCPCEHCSYRMRRATATYWIGRAVRALAGIEPIAAPRRN